MVIILILSDTLSIRCCMGVYVFIVATLAKFFLSTVHIIDRGGHDYKSFRSSGCLINYRFLFSIILYHTRIRYNMIPEILNYFIHFISPMSSSIYISYSRSLFSFSTWNFKHASINERCELCHIVEHFESRDAVAFRRQVLKTKIFLNYQCTRSEFSVR